MLRSKWTAKIVYEQHVAIIKNMKQDVSTRTSLSTAGYKVYTLYPVVDKDLYF